jgi:predicted O-methyltransferase YrrM
MRKIAKKLVDRYLVPLVAYVAAKARPNREPNVVDEVIRDAIRDSADYANSKMQTALYFTDRQRIWDFAFAKIELDGLFAEFGVYKGYSINYFARKLQNSSKTIYGFDSFEGLKEDWAGHETAKGDFSLEGSLPVVESNVQLIKGWFDQTVPVFLAEKTGPFAFIHVDSDTYEAAQTLFRLLDDRITAGTVIMFDEYFGYRGWRLGEWKAWQEYTSAKALRYEYLVFGPTQVAVKVR